MCNSLHIPYKNLRYASVFTGNVTLAGGIPRPQKTLHMSFAIIRTQKLKTASEIGASEQHCKRLKDDVPNADPKLSKRNFELPVMLTCKRKFKATSLNGRVNEYLDAENVKIRRKDAVKCIEVMMTASPDFFEGKKLSEVKEWAKFSREFLSRHFLEESAHLVGFFVHMDEKTPHIHAHIVPTTHDEKTEGLKLNCREFLGGPQKMRELQNAYAEHMQRNYPELERGIERKVTRADHKTLKNFYQATELLEQSGLNPGAVKKYIEEVKKKAGLKKDVYTPKKGLF